MVLPVRSGSAKSGARSPTFTPDVPANMSSSPMAGEMPCRRPARPAPSPLLEIEADAGDPHAPAVDAEPAPARRGQRRAGVHRGEPDRRDPLALPVDEAEEPGIEPDLARAAWGDA